MPLFGDAKRKYDREYKRKRRDAWILINGPCRQCGSADRLEVDHIDPNEKRINAGRLWTMTKIKRETELAKCQVLCRACHKKKTSEWYASSRQHGTRAMYRRKCRCDQCRNAVRILVNEWRWKTGRRKKQQIRCGEMASQDTVNI